MGVIGARAEETRTQILWSLDYLVREAEAAGLKLVAEKIRQTERELSDNDRPEDGG